MRSVSRNAKSQILHAGCCPAPCVPSTLSKANDYISPHVLHVFDTFLGVGSAQRSPEREVTRLRSVGITRAPNAHSTRFGHTLRRHSTPTVPAL